MASYPKKTSQQPSRPTLSAVESAPAYEPAPDFESAAAEPVAAVESFQAEAVAAMPAPSEVKAEAAKAFEAPAAALTKMQDKARQMIEKTIVEGRANYAKVKAVADETTSAIEASVSAAKNGVVEMNVKAIEAFKAGADANFDFLKSLLSAGSMSQYVTLHSEFTRKQFEAATAQSKEFATLARKVADETVAPIKAQVAKTFKVAV